MWCGLRCTSRDRLWQRTVTKRLKRDEGLMTLQSRDTSKRTHRSQPCPVLIYLQTSHTVYTVHTINKGVLMSNSKATTKKSKLVRDSFSLPKSEYASIETMKKRAMAAGVSVKKSELLRAGLMWLVGASDSAFKAALMAVPTLKTGRPAAEAPEKPLAKTIAKPANKPAATKIASARKVAAAKKKPMKAASKTATKMSTRAPAKTPTKAPVKAQAKPAIANRAAPAKAP
jgi:hypothetical protein